MTAPTDTAPSELAALAARLSALEKERAAQLAVFAPPTLEERQTRAVERAAAELGEIARMQRAQAEASAAAAAVVVLVVGLLVLREVAIRAGWLE